MPDYRPWTVRRAGLWVASIAIVWTSIWWGASIYSGWRPWRSLEEPKSSAPAPGYSTETNREKQNRVWFIPVYGVVLGILVVLVKMREPREPKGPFRYDDKI